MTGRGKAHPIQPSGAGGGLPLWALTQRGCFCPLQCSQGAAALGLPHSLHGPRVGWSGGGRGRGAAVRTAGTRGAAAGAPSGALGRFREHSVNFVSLRQCPAARGGPGPPRRGGARLGSARLAGARQDAARPGPAMASPSRRLQTKPVITCLKSVLLTYTFVFWVSAGPSPRVLALPEPRGLVAAALPYRDRAAFSLLRRYRASCCWPWACGAG